jgi:hypothetical protein
LGVCIGETTPQINEQAACAANYIATAQAASTPQNPIIVSQEEANQIAAAVFADPRGVDLSGCTFTANLQGSGNTGSFNAKDAFSCGGSQLVPNSTGNPLALFLPAFGTWALILWRRRGIRRK